MRGPGCSAAPSAGDISLCTFSLRWAVSQSRSAAKNILWFGLCNLFLNWPKATFLGNHSLRGLKPLVNMNARGRQKHHPLGWDPRHHFSASQHFAGDESRGSRQKWLLQGHSGQQYQCCHKTVKGPSEGTMGTGSA